MFKSILLALSASALVEPILAAKTVNPIVPKVGQQFQLQVKVKPGQPHQEFNNQFLFSASALENVAMIFSAADTNGKSNLTISPRNQKRANGRPYYNLRITTADPQLPHMVNPYGPDNYGSWTAASTVRIDKAKGGFYFDGQKRLRYAQSPQTPRRENLADFMICNWSYIPQLFIRTYTGMKPTKNCALVNLVAKPPGSAYNPNASPDSSAIQP